MSDAESSARDADEPVPFEIVCERPFLVAAFREPQATLSWAMARPGFQTARRVAWLEVAGAELTREVDAHALLAARLERAGLGDAVAMMTSRDVRRWRSGAARAGAASARCLATVGLSNAGRVGAAPPRAASRLGTINLLVAASGPLSQAALVEALSIAAEARTAAVMETGWRVGGSLATGTGTDCIVVAAPDRPGGDPFAGLHTEVGQAIGAAVHRAVRDGAVDWIGDRDRSRSAPPDGVPPAFRAGC